MKLAAVWVGLLLVCVGAPQTREESLRQVVEVVRSDDSLDALTDKASSAEQKRKIAEPVGRRIVPILEAMAQIPAGGQEGDTSPEDVSKVVQVLAWYSESFLAEGNPNRGVEIALLALPLVGGVAGDDARDEFASSLDPIFAWFHRNHSQIALGGAATMQKVSPVPVMWQSRAWARTITRIRMVALLGGIIEYRWLHGSFPSDLTTLGELAIDPVSGEPIELKVLGAREVDLFAKGPDGSEFSLAP